MTLCHELWKVPSFWPKVEVQKDQSGRPAKVDGPGGVKVDVSQGEGEVRDWG